MNPVRQAIYSTLAGSGPVTSKLSAPDAIYFQRAPQDAATPYVVFHRQTGRPTWMFAGDPIENDQWTVKAVHRSGSATRAEEIAEAIDLALHDAELQVEGRSTLYVRRETDIDYPEDDGANTIRHCGAVYRVVTE